MEMSGIPFGTTDWDEVGETIHPGETGVARWRTREFGEIRVRVVEYSPGYRADHWCEKGHILYVLDGVLQTELGDGRTVTLTPGTSYQVADAAQPHRSFTETGARLFIVD
ncbi:MAG: DHCW motif cupin fold protein [Stellaceae bacterium]